jgi:hypothetical protein
MQEHVVNATSYKVGPSPYELKPAEVIELVRNSTSQDWLYIEEDDVYSYRQNLLVRMERHGSQGEYLVYFGAQRVAKADVVQVLEKTARVQSVVAALAV